MSLMPPTGDKFFDEFISLTDDILDNLEAVKGLPHRILAQLMVMMTLQYVMMKKALPPEHEHILSLHKNSQAGLLIGIAREVLNLPQEDIEAIVNLSSKICQEFFDAKKRKHDSGK